MEPPPLLTDLRGLRAPRFSENWGSSELWGEARMAAEHSLMMASMELGSDRDGRVVPGSGVPTIPADMRARTFRAPAKGPEHSFGTEDDPLRPGGVPGISTPAWGSRSAQDNPLRPLYSNFHRATLERDCTNVVWQKHPLRLVRYRARDVHCHGGIPLTLRQLKASVLGRAGLHVQSLLLFLWAFFFHSTAAWMSVATRVAIVDVFGTGYLGALLNLSMVVTFVLGLFVSSVISRWWELREQYALLRSTSVDLAVMICSYISAARGGDEGQGGAATPSMAGSFGVEAGRGEGAGGVRRRRESPGSGGVGGGREGGGDSGGDSGGRDVFDDSPERHCQDDRLSLQVKETLIRYLNLGHVLMLLQVAGGPTGMVLPSGAAPPQATVTAAAAVEDMPDCGGLSWAMSGLRRLLPGSGSPTVQLPGTELGVLLQGSGAYVQGLLKPDELERLQMLDCPDKYVLVYQWMATLLKDVADRERLVYAPLMLPTIYGHISTVRGACARIITYVNTQLPYTYVALLDLVVKLYLLMLATWIGVFLSVSAAAVYCSGSTAAPLMPSKILTSGALLLNKPSASECFDPSSPPSTGNVTSDGEHIENRDVFYGFGSSFFGMFLLYSTLLWANMVFQGLLDTHSLLDNPFSRGARGYTHPGKFVLRSSVEALVKVTTSLLYQADTLPADASLLRPRPKESLHEGSAGGSGDSSRAASQTGKDPGFLVGSMPFDGDGGGGQSGRSEGGKITSTRSLELSGMTSNLIG